jgi:hypothetical protein
MILTHCSLVITTAIAFEVDFEQWRLQSIALRPNPSLKRSTNGRPSGPGLWHTVHFHSPGPDGLPLARA